MSPKHQPALSSAGKQVYGRQRAGINTDVHADICRPVGRAVNVMYVESAREEPCALLALLNTKKNLRRRSTANVGNRLFNRNCKKTFKLQRSLNLLVFSGVPNRDK